jgi:hypothetical protein
MELMNIPLVTDVTLERMWGDVNQAAANLETKMQAAYQSPTTANLAAWQEARAKVERAEERAEVWAALRDAQLQWMSVELAHMQPQDPAPVATSGASEPEQHDKPGGGTTNDGADHTRRGRKRRSG